MDLVVGFFPLVVVFLVVGAFLLVVVFLGMATFLGVVALLGIDSLAVSIGVAGAAGVVTFLPARERLGAKNIFSFLAGGCIARGAALGCFVLVI